MNHHLLSNPQTCCQIMLDHKMQLVEPAIVRRGIEIERTCEAWIEGVVPEKVIVGGRLLKTVTYQALNSAGIVEEDTVKEDEVRFQCMIDRDDANEGDEEIFEVVGCTILGTVFEELINFGTRPLIGDEFEEEVAFKLIEKDIIKVCVRRTEEPPEPGECCTNTIGWWGDRNDSIPDSEYQMYLPQNIGTPGGDFTIIVTTPDEARTIIQTTPPPQYNQLRRQLLAAKLNLRRCQLNVEDPSLQPPEEVATAMETADDYFANTDPNNPDPPPVGTIDILSAFNEGAYAEDGFPFCG
ncbi:hypothetical protein ACFFJI_00510 [Allobacillus sp. GCM10007491]|uniref:Uncharacterized protein n=1 Tax=Allobacillus saliphilus TaxID=2912308 RepID=A0A941CW61_9BACI|nr:hypothetical protein [Allobacillus saliphilus]MBR7553775.1 hypothetical protein [Allobacillus saliphilus]